MIEGRVVGAAAVQRKLRQIPRQAATAAVRTLNRAAQSARTAASREIRRQVGLSKRYVDGKLALQKASQNRLEARVSAAKRGVLLTRFAYRVRADGVAVRVKPSGAFKLLPGAFTIALPNLVGDDTKDPQAIVRRAAGSGRKFDVLYGPSVSQVYRTVRRDIEPGVRAQAREELRRQLRLAVQGRLSQRGVLGTDEVGL